MRLPNLHTAPMGHLIEIKDGFYGINQEFV